MSNFGPNHHGFGKPKPKNTKRMFKSTKERRKFAKRNMDDVLDDFFKSETMRVKFTPMG